MNRLLTIIGLFGMIFVQAQVGINTDTPNATLDVKKNPNLAETVPQGFILPKITTAERSAFTNVEEGTMIYNVDQKCLEIYTGAQSWECISGTAPTNDQNLTLTSVGFDGTYTADEVMTAANKVKFELKNNGTNSVSSIDFSGAVSIVNGSSNISVDPTENNNVSLAAGASTVLSYSLTGTPQEGTLTATFNKHGLQAEQSTQVAPASTGSAIISSKTVYISSLIGSGNIATIQGEIKNLPQKMTIEIPYIQGQGSYNALTNSQTAAPGEATDQNDLTLDIPAGDFGLEGNLIATITVSGDGVYSVKQQSAGSEYTIATFPVTMGGSTFNVVIKGIGGIPGLNFGATNNDFLYLPLEVTGNINGSPYNKTWLNLNIGAEYAKVSSPSFNPSIAISGATAHGDNKLRGNYLTFDEAKVACPVGYHLPTKQEWMDLHQAETGSFGQVNTSQFWNQSRLPNLAAAGGRSDAGSFLAVGERGFYWSSDSNGSSNGWLLFFLATTSNPGASIQKSLGFSARCIKD